MSVEWIVELGWKSLLLAGLTLVVLALARSRSAAEKSLIGDAGLLSLLLLPVAIAWLPRLEIAAPELVGVAVASLAPPGGLAPASVASEVLATQAAVAFDWSGFAVGVYLVPVALLLAGLGYSLFRLSQLYSGARVLEDGRWLSALAAAQNRVGVKHGTALLISDEVSSPISWGVVRPVIMIDPGAHAATDRAEAIIAHELAHVERLDWMKLVASRVVLALIWFNPLVWLLARRCHQLREEAADDAVLRMNVATSDYAELLVTAVRHCSSRPLLAANGVAPSSSSIAQRVCHVLDSTRPRRAAAISWAVVALTVAMSANAALASSEPVLERSWGIDRNAGERAATQLSQLPGTHARTLAAAIRTRDWSVRRVAGDTNFDEPRAIGPLLLALRDDDPVVRRIAVRGLSELRPSPDPLAIPQVSRLLYDPSPEVRAEAAGAIGEFPSVRNSRSIEKLLLTDPSPMVRLRAAHALGEIQDPDSRPTLELAARDSDTSVRAKARWALGQVIEAEQRMNR